MAGEGMGVGQHLPEQSRALSFCLTPLWPTPTIALVPSHCGPGVLSEWMGSRCFYLVSRTPSHDFGLGPTGRTECWLRLFS
jgi:hypothetical protein